MYKRVKNQKISKIPNIDKEFISLKYLCILDFEFKSKQLTTCKIIELKKFGKYLILLTNEGSIYLYNTNLHKKMISSLDSYIDSRIFGSTSYEYKAKSIYLNKKRETLMIVYLKKSQNYTEMNCCELKYNSLNQLYNKNSLETPCFKVYFDRLFQKENLSGNGFIEYDEFNNKILTKDAHNVFKIWDLIDYKIIFILCDLRVDEVRVTYNALMTLQINNHIVKLNTFDINTGAAQINYEIKISSEHSIEIFELFESMILIKQQIFKPVLFNLQTNEYYTIENDNFSLNSHFIYNYKSKIIVAINETNIQFFKLNGEIIKTVDRMMNTVVEDSVLCSDDFKFLFFYFPNKVYPSVLDRSFIFEKVRNTNYDSFPSNKSKFFTKSIQKEIEMISDRSCEQFLNSQSISVLSIKENSLLNNNDVNTTNNLEEISRIGNIIFI